MSAKHKIITSIFLIVFIGFVSCKKDTGYRISTVESRSTDVDQKLTPDSEVITFINPYKKSIDSSMSAVLAHCPRTLTKKDSKLNTAIGNMMADAIFELGNPIFESRTGYPFNGVLLNYGGIRASINEGDITTRTAYEVMPFENEVVVVELSGYQIKEMFNYLSHGTAHPISNIQIVLNTDGSLKEGRIQGQLINDNETYFIATSDYLQNGGDNMTFFSKPVSLLPLDYKIRNILIDYFTKKDTIAPTTDQRFTKL